MPADASAPPLDATKPNAVLLVDGSHRADLHNACLEFEATLGEGSGACTLMGALYALADAFFWLDIVKSFFTSVELGATKPPLQPLDHTSISQMRKDLEAAHQKQLHAKGDHSP